MTDAQAQEVLDKIIGQIFGFKNPLGLEDFKAKYAFDVRLPAEVNDSYTGETTWAQSVNPTKFMTMENTLKLRPDWMQAKQPLNNIQDILKAWEPINFTTTERQIDSLNFAKSDNIYQSENIYNSLDVHNSKNVLFCDSVKNFEYVAASQRSNASTYSARIEDSTDCSNSFSVSWSGKISNSFFIHDSYELFECMFCSHIRGKQFCVANIQLEEAEYFKLKEQVARWVLAS